MRSTLPFYEEPISLCKFGLVSIIPATFATHKDIARERVRATDILYSIAKVFFCIIRGFTLCLARTECVAAGFAILT